jgi:hypothetical protein
MSLTIMCAEFLNDNLNLIIIIMIMNIIIINGSADIVFGLGRFFSSLTLNIVGTTPWTGDQPVARPLTTRRTSQTE